MAMFPVESREHEVTSVWSPPCLKHEKFSPLRTEVLDKQSRWDFREEAHSSYGQLIKVPLVSRTQLCSSAHLNLISCGFQIIFYFQLCCCSHYRFGGYCCSFIISAYRVLGEWWGVRLVCFSPKLTASHLLLSFYTPSPPLKLFFGFSLILRFK